MAGLGRRTFAAGEVLTAGNVMGYLQDQAVMVFASAAARTTAIPTPSEGMVTYLSDINDIQVYDGASWLNVYPPSASDITAGTLAVARGGSGGTTGSGLHPIIAPTISISGAAATANTLVTVPFTAATSISLNSIFTSTYKNYRVVINAPSNSASCSIYYRFRAAGADNSSVNYYFGGSYGRTSGVTGGYSSGGAAAAQGTIIWANGETFVTADIGTPQTSTRTTIVSNGYGSDATSGLQVTTAGLFTLTNQFDGISFICSTGNFTGTIAVYGYND